MGGKETEYRKIQNAAQVLYVDALVSLSGGDLKLALHKCDFNDI